jgi:hypothetical protein
MGPPQVWYDKIHFSIWETKTIENNQISYSICIAFGCTQIFDFAEFLLEIFLDIFPKML